LADDWRLVPEKAKGPTVSFRVPLKRFELLQDQHPTLDRIAPEGTSSKTALRVIFR
jgi:hypothetical protein